MNVMTLKPWRLYLALICCSLPISIAFAVTYDYPNGPIVPVAPLTMANGDTANFNSGTFATTDTSIFTIQLGPNTTTQTVNVLSGATVNYQGTSSSGSTIRATRNDAIASTEVVFNQGTISSGTGLFAIYMSNSVGATAANVINIRNQGVINGNIFCNGAATTTLFLDGSVSINGGISLTPKTGGTSNIFVGQLIANTNFTTNGSVQDVSLVRVQQNSTMTFNNISSEIVAITIDAGSTINANQPISGLALGDGAINNSGIFNISANINKTGIFRTLAGGVTNVRQAVTTTVSQFIIDIGATYGSIYTDILNYGSLTISNSSILTNIRNLAIGYEGGYLPGRAYTLVYDINNGVLLGTHTLPSNTMFLTFQPPMIVDGDKIQQVIDRVPYTSYAQTTMTEQVAAALELIGSSPNPPASFVAVLNAVERSTNASQLESALRQLAPLMSAPVYGIELQSAMIEQVELRLAELHNAKTYFAGDLAIQNAFWVRGFGDRANQGNMGDSVGYYASTGGVAVGLDRYVDTGFLLGVAGSYGLSHVREKINAAASTDIKSYQFMLYGSVDLSANKYVNWALAAAANNYDGYRYMNINGTTMTATSSYSSQIYGAKWILGKNFSSFNFLQVNPEVSAQYNFAKQYEYSEQGAPGANLQVSRVNSNVLQLGAGGKLLTPLDWHPGICVPELHAMAYYNVINGAQTLNANFLAGGGLIVANMPLPRSWLKIGAAVTFALLDRMQVKINYDHWIADRFTDNSLYINFKFTL